MSFSDNIVFNFEDLTDGETWLNFNQELDFLDFAESEEVTVIITIPQNSPPPPGDDD